MAARTKQTRSESAPWVGVVMGSKNDLKVMSAAVDLLTEFAIPHEVRIVSAHRTPDWMFEYAESAESRGIEVIIAAAGGAAHLPGMIAAKTVLPVLGVPVGTLAIGEPGAANAALLAAAIVSASRPELRERLRAWRSSRAAEVLTETDLTARRAR